MAQPALLEETRRSAVSCYLERPAKAIPDGKGGLIEAGFSVPSIHRIRWLKRF